MSDSLNNVGLRSGVGLIQPEGDNIVVNNQSKNNQQHLDSVNGKQVNSQNQPDPGLNAYLNGNANSSFVPGRGQANNFAKGHEVISGKDWDFSDAENLRDLAKESFNNIKDSIDGKGVLNELDTNVLTGVNNFLKNNEKLSNAGKEEILNDLTSIKEDLRKLKEARAKLTKGLSSSSGENDPIGDLQIMRKTLRVFRYETQKILNKNNPLSTQMDFFEGKLRSIQNFFTFGIKDHVKEQDFADIASLEQQIRDKLESLNSKLKQTDPNAEQIKVPDEFSLDSTLEQTLEASHRTNDQIRLFEKKYSQNTVLREIITPYTEKGGHRTVEFTAGVGAFIGLGLDAVTAGVRAGARFRVTGEISCKGKGHPIEVTYRIGGGLEAKGVAKFGNEEAKTGVKAEASVGGQITKFVTRTYPSIDDMLLDIDRCSLATSRTIGSAILGGVTKIGKAIGNLGVKFFSFLGRHSGEVMQSNAEYLDSLKNRGVINALDGILAKRANPLIVAEHQGWTGHIQGQAQATFGLGMTGDLTASASAEHQRDFSVKSKIYVPFGRMVTGATDENALNQLLRPGADGITVPVLPDDNADLAKLFDETIDGIKDRKKVTTTDWAEVANQVRTLMVATELRCRRGLISRAEADRLLNRMTSPSVKFPKDIFREYLMEGSPAGKPAKIRTSAQVKLKISVLNDSTSGMTSGIGNVFVKAVADGAVKELRSQAALDSSYQYVYTSEKPASSSQDIRPWEQDVKTSHAIVVSDNAPFSAIIDIASKISAKKGEPPEFKSENSNFDDVVDTGKDLAKGVVKSATKKMVISTLIAGAKEGAKAAVINYLSKPENIEKIFNFIEKNAGYAFEKIMNIVEWVATHPDVALAVAEQAVAMFKGTTSLIESESTRTVRFNYVNGEMESVSISSNKYSSFGVNVDPLGVGLGVGFDVKYSVSESLNDRGILVKPTLNTLLSMTESYMLGDTSVKTVENSEALKNYLARNIITIKENLASIIGSDKSGETYRQAMLLASNDEPLKEKLESSSDKLMNMDENTPNNELVDALQDFLIAANRAYRITLPVDDEIRNSLADSIDDDESENSRDSSFVLLEV